MSFLQSKQTEIERHMKGRTKTKQAEVDENAQVRNAREAPGSTIAAFVPGPGETPYATAHAIKPNFSISRQCS